MTDYKITNDQTLEQIQEKFKEDDLKKYIPHYDKVSNPEKMIEQILLKKR